MRSIAVMGGGISGLACAYLIRQRLSAHGPGASVTLFEKASRTGGHIRTDAAEGFRCEWGPNGFLDNEPRMRELIEELGLTSKLVRSDDLSRRRFIYRGRALHALPETPPAFLKTRLLSPRAKARVLAEPLVPARRNGDEETVGDFGRRRLGRSFASAFLDPMVSGIFAGDIDRLSLPAAFPRMVELEREHGGLFRAMVALKRQRKRAEQNGGASGSRGPAGPGGVLHSIEGGMETLVRTLAERLGDTIRTGADVQSITPNTDGTFALRVNGEASNVDAVVLAAPAPAQGQWLQPWAGGVADALKRVAFAPISVVCLGYERDALAHPLDGFGLLIPRSEGIRTLGVLFTSTLFPDRTPDGHVLVRVLIGGAHDPAVAELSEAETLSCVRAEVAPILGERRAPAFVRVFRHSVGIPQYNLGHPDVVDRANEAEARWPGLVLTGNWLRGISMNLCVRDAFRVADRVCTPRVAPVETA